MSSLLIELILSSFFISWLAPPLRYPGIFDEDIVWIFSWLLLNDLLVAVNIEARRIMFHRVHFFLLRKIEGSYISFAVKGQRVTLLEFLKHSNKISSEVQRR